MITYLKHPLQLSSENTFQYHLSQHLASKHLHIFSKKYWSMYNPPEIFKRSSWLEDKSHSLTLTFTTNQKANKMNYTYIYYAWSLAVVTISCITSIYSLKYCHLYHLDNCKCARGLIPWENLSQIPHYIHLTDSYARKKRIVNYFNRLDRLNLTCLWLGFG